MEKYKKNISALLFDNSSTVHKDICLRYMSFKISPHSELNFLSVKFSENQL